jgi:mannose-6-phosphate isomerase
MVISTRDALSEKSYKKKMDFVSKPWGHEVIVANTDQYCGKIIFIQKGQKCELQSSETKDKTLYVQNGECHFRIYDPKTHLPNEEDFFVLKSGESWHVTPNMKHEMTALTNVNIVEFSNHS